MNLSNLTAGGALILFPLCLSATSIADVLYVDASGNSQFTDIQLAINAALDGDVLLVRSGSYAGFTIDNRRLWVVADAGAQVKINTTVTLRNMGSNGLVLLSGLDVSGASSYSNAAPNGLNIENNLGHVRVQGCTVHGGLGQDNGVTGAAGGHATSILNSAKVAFVGSSLLGGNGGGIPLWVITGGKGGNGVVTQGSSVAFYDCLLRGGVGGMADYIAPYYRAGDGGTGCEVLDFGILASGCQFQGGMGGSEATIPGNGGDGLWVNAGQAQLIGDTYAAGAGGYGYSGNFGQSGLPQAGTGVFHTFSGTARKISAPTLAAENGTLTFNVTGEVGDRVWLFQSALPDFVYTPSSAGTRLISLPALQTNRPHATLPNSGVASIVVSTPNLGAGVPALRQYWQCFVVNAAGQTRLGSALQVGVLNCSDLLPDCNANNSCDSCDLLRGTSIDCDKNGVPDECETDCNGNGIADPCDIASGTSVDLNNNGIPDECEAQHTWSVDASAAPGGNGSAGAPFQTMAQAFAAAISRDSVVLANGTYQGPGNRDLNFGNRELVVTSLGGSANCIIDCQLQGRAFIVQNGLTSASRIEGFTIQNAKLAGGNLEGGGMYISGSSPVIRNCVFLNCLAPSVGGAIAAEFSSPLIQSCTFDGNKTSTGPGGALYLPFGSPRVLDCAFVNNRGSEGGAIYLSHATAQIERCSFLVNTSISYGGAVHAAGSHLSLDQCWIAGNTAAYGGAMSDDLSFWSVTNCTIVDNRATVRAGAAFLMFGSPPGATRTWRNCVVWNNTAPAGTTIEVQQGSLDIAWCDVQGGQASVTVGAQASLIWGLGNLAADPLFVDPDGPDNNPLTIGDNNYRLSLTSPCLDAGENASVAQDWFDLDGDGNTTEPVPFDFDGSARFVEIPSAPNTGSGVPPLVDLGAWERP